MQKMKKTICAALLAGSLLPFPGGAQEQRTLSVEELFALVESGSHSLQAQKAGVEEAIHGVASAKSQRLPEINTSLSMSYNGNVLMTDRNLRNPKGFSQPHIGNSFVLEAQQTIYAGGALNAGIRLAELQKEQAETRVSLTRSDLRFATLGQFLDLYQLDNSLKVYQSNLELTERLVADIKEKQVQGMALKNDVTRYELELENLRLELRRLEDKRAILNHQLCNTLGIETTTTILPETSLPDGVSSEDDEAGWQLRAAASSPLIRQSQLDVETAQVNLKMAKSELRPKLAVVASELFSGPFTYDIPPIDKNFNIWYVGVGVKYSLSALYKSNKNVRRAKAAIHTSRENHALATENLNNRMQEAFTLYKQSFVDLKTQEKSVQLAAENYLVMNSRYLNQLALVTDMIDASNVKLNAELQAVNARINIVYAYYRMKYIAGEI